MPQPPGANRRIVLNPDHGALLKPDSFRLESRELPGLADGQLWLRTFLSPFHEIAMLQDRPEKEVQADIKDARNTFREVMA